MKTVQVLSLIALLAVFLAGCSSYQSLHYGWAYTPLHDAKRGDFQRPSGKVAFRRLDGLQAMADAERQMYRDGYVMVGYSNMISPQLEMFGSSGAEALGKSKGASTVLATYGRGHYLATLWARPKTLVLGAYFTDALPEGVADTLKEYVKTESGVIVSAVVTGSPASRAGIRPGDLLFSVNGERIEDETSMTAQLQRNAGKAVTLGVWSMSEGAPRSVAVTLAK